MYYATKSKLFISVLVSQYQHSSVYFIVVCTLRFLVFLSFFRFSSCIAARSSQSFYIWWLKWGNPTPEEDCNQARELLRPQVPQLLFLGSIADVFKWEKCGFKCKVFLWKLFFPLKSTLSGRQICPSLKLTLTKKQSAESGAPPRSRRYPTGFRVSLTSGISCMNSAQKKVGLGFR